MCRRPLVNVQIFVSSRRGNQLDLHFEVLSKQDSTGPASVLCLITEDDMYGAAENMVRRLSLSGLHGLDWMLETYTGKPYLIEMNLRATQVGHLALWARP